MSIPVEISFYEMNIGILYQLFIRLFDSNGVFNDLLVMLIQIVYLNFIRCNYDAKYVGWDSDGGWLLKIWSTPTFYNRCNHCSTIGVIMTNFVTIAIAIIIPGGWTAGER